MAFDWCLSKRSLEIELIPRGNKEIDDYQLLSKYIKDSWESIPPEDRDGWRLEWWGDRDRRKNWDRWELVEEEP